MSDGSRCPCRSGADFAQCCEPLLTGRAAAPTALALMRSRFTAYAMGAGEYLLTTWHPSTRPDSLALDPATEWRTLHIVDTVAGGPDDDTGVVEFVARFREHGTPGLLAERSRFVRERGAWRYLDAVPSGGLGG